MARESKYSIEPQRVIFRETFNSEFDVRRNGGVPTDVTFSNGVGMFNGSTTKIAYSNVSYSGSGYTISVRTKRGTITDTFAILFGYYAYAAIIVYENGNISMLDSAGSAANIWTDVWTDKDSYHLITFVVSAIGGGSTVELYFDGILQGSSPKTTYPINQFIVSGFVTTGVDKEFIGDIDLVKIYNYALSAEEVKNLYEGKRFRALVSPTEILNVNALSGSIDDGYGVSDVFISTWKTDNAGSSGDTQIALPLEESGIYDFSVDWGDGNSDIITVWNQAETTHTYAGTGTYTVGISGVIKGWRFNNGGDKLKILTVENWGDLLIGNSGDYFHGCTNLVVNATDILNVSNVTNMTNAFLGCVSITSMNVSAWDVSNVTTFYNAFKICTLLESLDVSSWDVSSVNSFYGAFYSCPALLALDVSNWDVSAVTTFHRTFSECSSLITLDVSSWNVGNVTSFNATFRDCSSLITLDVSSWVFSSLNNFYDTFYDCSSLLALDVSTWNMSAIISLTAVFDGCSSLTTLDVSSWNVSNVTFMDSIFSNCTGLTTLNVSGWSTGNVTSFNGLFNGCSSLTGLNVSSWNTGNVTNFDYAFKNCVLLTDIGVDNWNVLSITTAVQMFYGVTLTVVKYDAILIAWEGQAVQNNVSFHAGNSKYTGGGAAEAARTALINDHNWSITDGGGI